MNEGTILVTGGAGYVGSHAVKSLGEAGERIVTLDDLSTGRRESVLYGDLVVGDIGDPKVVGRVLREYGVDTVMHFAAHTVVPESVQDPLKYYRNNTCASRNLLECCADAGVERIVFSSTAAVYGTPESGIADENGPVEPINPYGSSKLMTEVMLRDLAEAGRVEFVSLRYFNVAGADPDCMIGQSTHHATLLVKVAAEAAVGRRSHVAIYGTDYPTPDGTGVRDYVHVTDVARAHVYALEYLRQGGGSTTLNCGYGHGFSVRQVLEAIDRVNGRPIEVHEESRRAGDPPTLVARADRIRQVLGWSPEYDDLDFIVRTALDWEKALAEGNAGGRGS